MNQHIERIALFIDGSNLYAAARSLGFDIDYKKLLHFFKKRGYLVRALYYTALIEDQEYSPIRPLVDWLDYNGYTMVTKPTKEFTDASGRRKIKGNMDIELAVDVLEMAQNLDHLYIFSGDGDFRRLVEAVQRQGKRVSIVSTVRSSPSMAADELRRQADEFLELENLMPEISRGGTRRPPVDVGMSVSDVTTSEDTLPVEIYEDDGFDDYNDEDDITQNFGDEGQQT